MLYKNLVDKNEQLGYKHHFELKILFRVPLYLMCYTVACKLMMRSLSIRNFLYMEYYLFFSR